MGNVCDEGALQPSNPFFLLLLCCWCSSSHFKYAGDNMETPSGEKYMVVREDDILCKA